MAASPQVATYDLQPEMSAGELMDKAVESIKSEKFDFIVLNFANPDMVGHTGVMEAAVKAVETVDVGLGRIANALDEVGGAAVVIADHGNCEQMIDPKTGGPHTAHTTNLVPCILLGKGLENETMRDGGRLADVAPTLLNLLNLPQPDAMTGISLLGAAPDQVDSFEASENDDMAHITGELMTKLQALQKLYVLLGTHAAGEGTASEHGAQWKTNAEQLKNQSENLSARAAQNLSIANDSSADDSALSLPELVGATRQLESELQEFASTTRSFE